ncbi:hypothetical protein CUT44_06385 [Streptomyces carminius]|uniref:Pyrrolo-quinoline quinone repeat domain-containing protein n=1 Tax=Streptomyces carminius TaxID=2665496 RepID=A0A2M8M2B4_9ACTN|nr:PQQ-binding-like beta-propeller repeat protein [Streptomyces carminius]PJE98345.1 hypothetical protein CUT44_06385 [Streptomyces carminius]
MTGTTERGGAARPPARRPEAWHISGPVAVLLSMPLGASVTSLLLGGLVTLLNLGGRGSFWWAFGGFLGTVFTFVLVIMARQAGLGRVWTGLLTGGALAAALGTAAQGDSAARVWAAAPDRPADAAAVGSWQDGKVVVRARPDAVTGYRVTDGTVVWEWTPPGRDTVCAMSRNTSGGTGVLGHAPGDAPCATAAALDLTTGEIRWSARVTAPGGAGGAVADLVAVSGGVAVLPERGGWRAVGLADGRERWRAATEPGCVPLLAGTGHRDEGTVAAVADCGPEEPPVLRLLAAADGSAGVRAELPAAGRPRHTAVLATDPLTVWVHEKGVRGTRAVVRYDDTGRPAVTVPVNMPGHEIRVMPGEGGTVRTVFAARPVRTALVTGDTLIASGARPDDRRWVEKGNKNGGYRIHEGRLVAYSLTDGRHLWTRELDRRVEGVAVDGDDIWVLSGDRLARVGPAAGTLATDLYLHHLAPLRVADLWVAGDRYTVVTEDGTGSRAPVGVLAPVDPPW